MTDCFHFNLHDRASAPDAQRPRSGAQASKRSAACLRPLQREVRELFIRATLLRVASLRGVWSTLRLRLVRRRREFFLRRGWALL